MRCRFIITLKFNITTYTTYHYTIIYIALKGAKRDASIQRLVFISRLLYFVFTVRKQFLVLLFEL